MYTYTKIRLDAAHKHILLQARQERTALGSSLVGFCFPSLNAWLAPSIQGWLRGEHRSLAAKTTTNGNFPFCHLSQLHCWACNSFFYHKRTVELVQSCSASTAGRESRRQGLGTRAAGAVLTWLTALHRLGCRQHCEVRADRGGVGTSYSAVAHECVVQTLL